LKTSYEDEAKNLAAGYMGASGSRVGMGICHTTFFKTKSKLQTKGNSLYINNINLKHY
jgi:hypothetical protein